MFGKLMKHDWRRLRGGLGLMCLVMLTGSIVAGGSLALLQNWEDVNGSESLVSVLCVLGFAGGVFTILMASAAVTILPLVRFYQSRFTDQGYLTFTLPVSVHQNLLSSLLSTCLCILLGILATVGAFALIGGIYIASVPEFWKELPQLWSAFWDHLPHLFDSNRMLFQMLLSMMPTAILSGLCQLVTVMLAITLGAVIAKKHKILAAVAVYYGIHLAMTIVQTIVMGFPAMMMLVQDAEASVAMVLLPQNLLSLAVIVGSYFLMHYLLKHKLNLN